jgi:L-alanine-DL-glutamate epimerase-like enolase superfamily enzyme
MVALAHDICQACAILGENPVVRITTDEGIDGYGEAENPKPTSSRTSFSTAPGILGEDPTNVERVMLKSGAGRFKPWGSAVSAIEMALWDIAGKAAGARSTSCWAARCATRCASTTARCASR